MQKSMRNDNIKVIHLPSLQADEDDGDDIKVDGDVNKVEQSTKASITVVWSSMKL
jgi:hypothetical protein